MQKTKANVLIVDDDETITWTLTAAIRNRDPDVQTYIAQTGLEALGYIKQLKHLDILVTDIHMPELSGIDLLTQIQKEPVDPDILVITGYGSRAVHEQVEDLGAIRYWTKPFDINLLAEEIINILKNRTNRKKHPGFTGGFNSMKMVDIIQINCLLQKKGLLRVHSGSNSGKIYFAGGEVVHAETKQINGEEALYHIIDWGSGDFELTDQVSPAKQTINKTWEFLLIEHSRRSDDRAQHP